MNVGPRAGYARDLESAHQVPPRRWPRAAKNKPKNIAEPMIHTSIQPTINPTKPHDRKLPPFAEQALKVGNPAQAHSKKKPKLNRFLISEFIDARSVQWRDPNIGGGMYVHKRDRAGLLNIAIDDDC
jgi:hypothetical protein